MNGEQNPVPPPGWQFKPEDKPKETATPIALAPSLPEVAANIRPEPNPGVSTPQSPSEPAPPVTVMPAQEPAPPVAVAPAAVAKPRQAGSEPLEWSVAEEPHQRAATSMPMLLASTVLLAAIVYLLSRDIFNAVAVVAAGLLFAAYNARKPQMVHYRLDNQGLLIGRRHYDFSQFRSFAVEEGSIAHMIVLMPLKRFMPMLTLGYQADMEDQIVAALAERLPMEAFRRDAMDAISRKLRF